MQAEHIPVHLGAMPVAVAAVLGEEQRPGDAWILNDPYRGGTHLPDITLVSPVFVGRRAGGLCRQPRPPRGRRRQAARQHAGRLAHARRGGRCDPAEPARERGPARRGAARGSQRPNAQPRPAASRPARPARRRPCGRLTPHGAGGALRDRPGARGDARDARLRRAPHARAHRGAGRRRARGPRRARGGGRRPRAPAARRGGGRRAAARLQRFGGAARRQPQLPTGGHAVRLLLRGARAHRPRRAGLRRRLPAGDRHAPRRARCSTRARRPRWSPATWRPRRGWRTSCWPRSAARSARAR